MTSGKAAAHRYSARKRGRIPPKRPRASAPIYRGEEIVAPVPAEVLRRERNERRRERIRARRELAEAKRLEERPPPRWRAPVSGKGAVRRMVRRAIRRREPLDLDRIAPRLRAWAERELRRLAGK